MARTLLGGLEHATFYFFVFAARLLLVFASIHLPCDWSVHKSLAPRTRTLLAVLGQATLNFVAVVVRAICLKAINPFQHGMFLIYGIDIK